MAHKTGRVKKQIIRLRNKKTGRVITLKRVKRMPVPPSRVAITGIKKVMRMLGSIKRKGERVI